MGADGTVDGAAGGRPDGWRPAVPPGPSTDPLGDGIRRIRLTLFALAETAEGGERAAVAAELGRGFARLGEMVVRTVEPVVAPSIPGDVRRQIHQERHELRRQVAAVRRRWRRVGHEAGGDPVLAGLIDDLASLAARHLARLEDELLGPWTALDRPEQARRTFAAAPAADVPGSAPVAASATDVPVAVPAAVAAGTGPIRRRRMGWWFGARVQGAPAAPSADGVQAIAGRG